MSEALGSAIRKVDMRRHIDGVQRAVTSVQGQTGKRTDDKDANLVVEAIQGALRDECSALAKEIKLGGGNPLRFMLTNAIISVAWSAFSIKKASLDQSLPFGETLEMVDLASSLGDLFDFVAEEAGRYAELSDK
ncbi:MAG: hypothetical protein OK455_07985 [Thaumarchaeota archaeon]|nr:hypothetical protein [Nitrososphaerota archaeon]